MPISNSNRYDLIVIGAGSGGVRAARLAAAHGLRVAVIERQRLGGTCVNVGCVPKKLYSYAASLVESLSLARGYGWHLPVEATHHWQHLQTNVSTELQRLNGVYARLLENSGAEVIFGSASFVAPHQLLVNDRQLSANKILIATGSTPTRPQLPGSELFAISDDFFHWQHQPESLLVYGGGYIGLELAAISASLGVQTHLVVRKPLPLSGFDDDMRKFIAEQLPACGVQTHFGASITRLDQHSGAVRAELSNGEALTCSRALAATGRKALVADLNLERVGVQLSESGAVVVNSHYQSNVEHIYALGDVIGRVALTPVAIAEAKYFYQRHIIGSQPQPINYQLVPTAVFTHPNVGVVGLSQQQAVAAGHQVKIFTNKFSPLRTKLANIKAESFYKLVVDADSDKVLGLHIAGENAAEITQGFAVALLQGISKTQLDQAIGIHPTSAEELVTM